MTAAVVPDEIGGTSPSQQHQKDLIDFAQGIFTTDNLLGPLKIHRMVRRFLARMPNADGWTFFLFITNEAQVSDAYKRAALGRPEVARYIGYHTDPTATLAARNVRH